MDESGSSFSVLLDSNAPNVPQEVGVGHAGKSLAPVGPEGIVVGRLETLVAPDYGGTKIATIFRVHSNCLLSDLLPRLSLA